MIISRFLLGLSVVLLTLGGCRSSSEPRPDYAEFGEISVPRELWDEFEEVLPNVSPYSLEALPRTVAGRSLEHRRAYLYVAAYLFWHITTLPPELQDYQIDGLIAVEYQNDTSHELEAQRIADEIGFTFTGSMASSSGSGVGYTMMQDREYSLRELVLLAEELTILYEGVFDLVMIDGKIAKFHGGYAGTF